MRQTPILRVVVMMVLACAWSVPWSLASAPHTPTHRGDRRSKRAAHETAKGCQDFAPSVQSEEGAVGWDPVSCWGCENTGEVIGWFVAGVMVTTPVCIFFIRRRTRRGEALGFKKMLPI